MLILSIETSCDETAVAIVQADKNNFTTLSNIVSSQVQLHAEWGGVVPNLAAREHLKNALPVLRRALKEAKVKLSNIDLIAVTNGPGLIPALLLGVNFAKTLAYFHQKPLVGVQHIAGHILSAFADNNFNFQIKPTDFPLLTLTVSGGHTQLIYTDQPLNYQIIGETQDDAAGEAFDKVAKILNLGYPGGPIISKLADEYIKENNINLTKLDTQPNDTSLKKFFPRPMINKPNFDFSFSGLKTAVLYYTQQNNIIAESDQKQISFEFQEAVADVLTTKTLRALKKYPAQTISLSGGVAANTRLRNKLENAIKAKNLKFKAPPLSLTGDNATMIAVAGYYQYIYHKQNSTLNIPQNNWRTLDAQADLKLSPQKINIEN
jgi:N6-L-threonylcarbamoyladenine synthase